jgi:hypothetical protein
MAPAGLEHLEAFVAKGISQKQPHQNLVLGYDDLSRPR